VSDALPTLTPNSSPFFFQNITMSMSNHHAVPMRRLRLSTMYRRPRHLATFFALLLLSCKTQSSFGFSLYIPSSSVPPPNNNNNDNSDDASSNLPESVPLDTPARKTLPSHLRLAEIPGKGLGVITTTPIPIHTVVGDYAGEIMTAEEKDRRYLESKSHLQTPVDKAWIKSRLDRQQTITGSYVYGIFTPSGSYIYSDAEDEDCSLWTRFLNHAPPPAANVNPKSIHESYDGNPRVWFTTIRDIAVGEELCFDYGDDYWLPGDDVV
jgi:hypothetical protein